MRTLVSLYLALLGFFGGVIVLTVVKVAVSLLGDEAKGWLERLPYGLLALAVRRLPEELRGEQVTTWVGDLDHLQEDLSTRPLTRLWTGTRFALSLLRSTPKIAGAFGLGRSSNGRILSEILNDCVAILGVPVAIANAVSNLATASGALQHVLLWLMIVMGTMVVVSTLWLIYRRVRRFLDLIKCV